MDYEYEFWQLLDELFAVCKIVIDRPKGSYHPEHKEYKYPLDYGFLAGTSAMDCGGIDIWVGTSAIRMPVAIISTIDFLKKDAEIKILYGCTKEEINVAYQCHNRTSGMKGLLKLRPDIFPAE